VQQNLLNYMYYEYSCISVLEYCFRLQMYCSNFGVEYPRLAKRRGFTNFFIFVSVTT
jgi:hypothetical protein